MIIIKKISRLALCIFSLFISNMAFATSGFMTQSSSSGMSATDVFGPIISLTVSIAYLIGVIVFILGLYGLKKHNENPQHYTIAYCVMNMLTGTFLLLCGTIYGIVRNSTLGGDWDTDNSALSITKHADVSMGDISKSFFAEYIPPQTIMLILGFIYFVGLVAFIRGIFLLKNVGSVNNGSQGGIGKSLTHMLGGVITMNITYFACLVGNTIGLTMLCGPQ